MNNLKYRDSKSNSKTSKVLESINKLNNKKNSNSEFSKKIQNSLPYMDHNYKISRAFLVPTIEKALKGFTSNYEPGENKDKDITKFYEATEVFHTDEKKQDKGLIIPVGYVNDGTDDYLDIFYNKEERAFECLGYTDKYFDQYKQILRLNKNVNPYIPDRNDNIKNVLDNINVGEYIKPEAYNEMEYIFEKFLHNIDSDYEDYNETLSESVEIRMFEAWENGTDGGMTRELHILIENTDEHPKYFVDFINNSQPLGNQIKYESESGWHSYPYKKIGEHLEISEDYNEIIARETYEWDRKTDISTLKDYQKVNIINNCDFRLIKFANEYRLEDIQQANLSKIEDERFKTIDEVINRLDTYIYDYYFRDREDELKISDSDITSYLNKREWTGGVQLYKKLQDSFKEKGEEFNLMNYSTLSLRDVCEEVGYKWLENTQKDNAILALDSTIARFK